MPLVDIRNVSFAYGPEKILDHIGFSLQKREIVCLIGPNGCGKTTLLDCILGFHRFQAGTLMLNGKDTSCMKRAEVAKFLAYVPQIHERTFPYTVKEIVTMGRAAYLGLFGTPSRKDRILAEKALDRIGILHLKNRPYIQLSGGEIQLVMIARALVQQTPVLIMDEPTSHLDFRSELVILEIMTELVKENDLSIIMATHIPNHAFYFQNNHIKTTIATLHKGGFMAQGPPETVLNEETLRRLYSIKAGLVTLETENGETIKHIVPLHTERRGEKDH